MQTSKRPTLIILGTGFAGFSLLKKIDVRLFRVIVVSPRNHFIFTPLLPSTTVGTIEFRSIIESIRKVRPDIDYYQARCKRIDHRKKLIVCEGGLDKKPFNLAYDYLAIAVGARSNTYGIPGVERYSLFLRDLADARHIRQRIIECLEHAAQPTIGVEERKRLLHFVVVGGGPTGVEFAAEMHDFLTEDLRKSYPGLTTDLKITLLEAGENILNSFDATLSEYTRRIFRRQKIEIKTKSPVKRVEAKMIILANGERIPYGLTVWSTGIGPTDFVKSLRLPKDRANRLLTDQYFRVKETPHPARQRRDTRVPHGTIWSGQAQIVLFALGDCSSVEGKNYPATAQVAQQQGQYLADALSRIARGLPVRPFRYKHYGMLAYVGSSKALADLSTIKGRGFSTWLFWRSAYLTRLVSLKNKILVIFDWLKTFVFGRDISRF